MTQLYLLEENRIYTPSNKGNPSPHTASDVAATALAIVASSDSQSRCGARRKVLLPSARVLQEKIPNADWMMAGYASWQTQTRLTGVGYPVAVGSHKADSLWVATHTSISPIATCNGPGQLDNATELSHKKMRRRGLYGKGNGVHLGRVHLLAHLHSLRRRDP